MAVPTRYTAKLHMRLPHQPLDYLRRVYGPADYKVQDDRAVPIVRPNPVLLTADENRRQVLKMYRKIVRSVPRVLLAYEISGGPMLERNAIANVRTHFTRHVGVTDQGVAAVLRHKAEMEVQEALMMWKTKSHVCNLLLETEDTPTVAKLMAQTQMEKSLPNKVQHSPFMQDFLQG